MKTALLFSGYGSQFVGMGKELYDEYRIVQEYFEEASHVLDINFVKLCFASSDAELSKMINAYSSLFLIGTSVYAILKEHNIPIDVVAGYNNGESAALFAAGCFSFPDGLYLLHKFCSFYQDAVDQMDVDALHIIGIATAQLEKACEMVSKESDRKIAVAIYNSPTDHIVTGNCDQLAELYTMFDGQATMEYIGAEVGLHSSLMNGVVDQFKIFLEKVDFKDLKIPLISCIDGAIITAGSDTKERFLRHINEPLEWFKIMRALSEYDCIVIANPLFCSASSEGKTHNFYDMIKNQYPDKTVITITTSADIEKIKRIVQVKNENTGLIDGN
ncbi:MAG TPA: ACP S-malonyltransferase [Candidatus Babeliales bacterium]|jgi:[acyl-carrier-protein] S-malonyltransferase|nr:ACP S-malonyltransferase [Candidatus Babeliales bacterium]